MSISHLCPATHRATASRPHLFACLCVSACAHLCLCACVCAYAPWRGVALILLWHGVAPTLPWPCRSYAVPCRAMPPPAGDCAPTLLLIKSCCWLGTWSLLSGCCPAATAYATTPHGHIGPEPAKWRPHRATSGHSGPEPAEWRPMSKNSCRPNARSAGQTA